MPIAVQKNYQILILTSEIASSDYCEGEVLFFDFSDLDYDVQWTGPNGFSRNDKIVLLEAAGEYSVVVTNAGGCEGILTKTLVVHPDSSSIPSAFQGQQEIIQFSLSPNPNMGNFNTIVEFTDPKSVVLSVFGLDRVEVDRRILNGQAIYSENYALSVTPGIYIMVLQTPTQRKSIGFSVLST